MLTLPCWRCFKICCCWSRMLGLLCGRDTRCPPTPLPPTASLPDSPDENWANFSSRALQTTSFTRSPMAACCWTITASCCFLTTSWILALILSSHLEAGTKGGRLCLACFMHRNSIQFSIVLCSVCTKGVGRIFSRGGLKWLNLFFPTRNPIKQPFFAEIFNSRGKGPRLPPPDAHGLHYHTQHSRASHKHTSRAWMTSSRLLWCLATLYSAVVSPKWTLGRYCQKSHSKMKTILKLRQKYRFNWNHLLFWRRVSIFNK